MTLIELIVFIVIVSTALAGVLTVLNITARSSADPMIRKQMLAIAEGLLEEVVLQPFTWCDPDEDAAAATATGYACTKVQNTATGKVGEIRGSNTTPLDNVFDYNGCGPGVAACDLASPIPSLGGTLFAPAGYSATISVTPEALNGVGDTTATSASLRIAVTVTHGADSIVLEGYRTRFAPNFPLVEMTYP
jgi:MSHA pilin protein MshD